MTAGAGVGTAAGVTVSRPESEEDLAHLGRRFVDGDEEALREAWRRWAPSVVRLGRRLGLDAHEADELVGSTFVTAWRARERFDPARGALPAWLVGVARHRALDLLRTRRPETPVDVLPEQARSAAPRAGADPLQQVVARATVAEALTWLPDLERQAMGLVISDGLSQRQVAAVLGLPEGTARSRISSATRRLRHWWEVSDGAQA